MTRKQLEAVAECLAEIVDSWNDGGADNVYGRVEIADESGRSDYGLCLTLHADGRGTLGRRGEFGNVEDFHVFGNFDGLCRVLEDGEGVEFDKE